MQCFELIFIKIKICVFYETIDASRYFFEFEIPSVLIILNQKEKKSNQKLHVTQIEQALNS